MYPETLPLSEPAIYTIDSFFGKDITFWATSYIMKNYSLNMHAQEWTEINIVISGNGMHYLGDKRFSVNRGDMFIVPPNVLHGYVCGNELCVYHIGIHPEFAKEYSKELRSLPMYYTLFEIEPTMRMHGAHKMHLTLTDKEFLKIKSLLNILNDASIEKTQSKLILTGGLTLAFISMVCDAYSQSSLNLEMVNSDKSDINFLRSIAYIYEHYDEKITVNELAKIANRSRNSYITIFKKYMKKSPVNFLLDYRLEQAKQLTMQTKMTISEIAHSTGFYDLSHLLHSFKEKYKATPTQYRNKKEATP